MKVAVTGATGFIGRALCNELAKEHNVIAFTRRPEKAAEVLDKTIDILKWDGKTSGDWKKRLKTLDAIVNLTGANLAKRRWSNKLKAQILNSRINASRVLVEEIKNSKVRPKVVILSSAIGFYGSRGDEKLDETSNGGEGFLAEVCREIENFAKEFEALVGRTVVIRTGIVLDDSGGALPKMVIPFRFYAGGFWGSGKQWMSWLSLADEVAAIKFLIGNDNLAGTFNLTSPNPLTNREFFSEVAAILKKPCWLLLPKKFLKAAFGEIAEELFLASQRVYPKNLIDAGFKFKNPELKGALEKMKIERFKSRRF